jgi:hypothetical protein
LHWPLHKSACEHTRVSSSQCEGAAAAEQAFSGEILLKPILGEVFADIMTGSTSEILILIYLSAFLNTKYLGQSGNLWDETTPADFKTNAAGAS